MPDAVKRFEVNLKPITSGCAIFNSDQKGPYHRFWDGHKVIGAPVFVYYAYKYGCMPMFVQIAAEICHSCANPRCCNPEHLILAVEPSTFERDGIAS